MYPKIHVLFENIGKYKFPPDAEPFILVEQENTGTKLKRKYI